MLLPIFTKEKQIRRAMGSKYISQPSLKTEKCQEIDGKYFR